jgi:hypothetical protein
LTYLEISASGSLDGDAMRNCLFREFSPLTRMTALFATPNCLARKAVSCLLALPSTGGAVILTRYCPSPQGPAKASALAFG